MLHSRRHGTPILQGFLSQNHKDYFTSTLKNGLLLRNTATKKRNNRYPHSSTTEQEILKRTSCFFFCQNQRGEPMQETTQTVTNLTAAPKLQTGHRLPLPVHHSELQPLVDVVCIRPSYRRGGYFCGESQTFPAAAVKNARSPLRNFQNNL